MAWITVSRDKTRETTAKKKLMTTSQAFCPPPLSDSRIGRSNTRRARLTNFLGPGSQSCIFWSCIIFFLTGRVPINYGR